MRIIARKTLKRFIVSLKGSKDQKAVKSALDSWFQEARQAHWKNPADVVKAYAITGCRSCLSSGLARTRSMTRSM